MPVLAAGHALHPAGLAHEGASPKRFCRVFGFFFLRLVALFCSLWVGGFPLAAFSLPLALVAFFLLGWWVPLAAFSPCFPRGSRGGGVAILSVLSLFSCYLLHLASLPV